MRCRIESVRRDVKKAIGVEEEESGVVCVVWEHTWH